MTEHQDAEWNVAAWHGMMLVDRDCEKIGKLQDGRVWPGDFSTDRTSEQSRSWTEPCFSRETGTARGRESRARRRGRWDRG